MRALVTGGLGFLGHSLCTQLLAAGHELTIVDDLSSAVAPREAYDGRARVVATDLESYTSDTTYDRVFHLASPVGPVALLDHGGSIGKRIVNQTGAVLDLAIASRAAIVFVSSSEVYGGTPSQHEDRPCAVPTQNTIRLEYGLGKRLAETIVENRMRAEGLGFRIIRPFNIAGPHQQATGGFVIPTFVNQALSGAPLTVFGDGAQSRAFGHVEDIARGIVLAGAESTESGVYNLGCPENATTIRQLAERIVALLDSASPIEFVDPVTIHGPGYTEAHTKMPEIETARRRLGWSPRRDLNSILEDVIAHRLAEHASG